MINQYSCSEKSFTFSVIVKIAILLQFVSILYQLNNIIHFILKFRMNLNKSNHLILLYFPNIRFLLNVKY